MAASSGAASSQILAFLMKPSATEAERSGVSDLFPWQRGDLIGRQDLSTLR